MLNQGYLSVNVKFGSLRKAGWLMTWVSIFFKAYQHN